VELVDLVRYPIDRLDGAEGRALVDRCRREFTDTGVVVLPDFLTPSTVAAIVDEAAAGVAQTFVSVDDHNVFLDDGPDGTKGSEKLDADDPRVRRVATRVGSIACDLLATEGALRSLHEWAPLTAFVGAVLGHDEFHRGVDPLGAVSINVYQEGDRHGWHFDESRFSVTAMVQESETGGHLEFVTGLRTDDAADLDAIRRVLDGDESSVQRLPFRPGSLSIFGGRNTMHRVTPVGGTRPRLVPVLTYDTQPGSVNSAAVQQLFWGRTAGVATSA